MSDPRAARYSRIKYSLSLLETLFLVAVLLVFSRSGLSQRLAALTGAGGGFPGKALYLAAAFFLYYTVSFPFTFYRSFLLERRFSLSTQSFADWAGDQAKSLGLSYAVSLIFLAVFYRSLAAFPGMWWLAVTLIWAALNVFFAFIAPLFIVPLFFKYTPVTDGPAVDRIRSLSERMDIPVTGVFTIDMSRKTVKANAGLMGWGKSRRVVLGDTLQAGYTPAEIEVILAHEFSHQKLRHLLKLMLINVCGVAAWLWLVHAAGPRLLALMGLDGLADAASIPGLLLIAVIFGLAAQPLLNLVSRRMERNADLMALRVTGLTDAFVSTMEKLGAQNLADPDPGALVKFFFFDHPPVKERIAYALRFSGRPS